MTNAIHILERIKWLRQFQPSAVRNSLLMLIIQIVSLVGAVSLMGLSIFKLTVTYPVESDFMRDVDALTRFNLELNETQNLLIAYYLLFGSVLLLFIWVLARMVIRRNAYILELNDVLDEESDQTR